MCAGTVAPSSVAIEAKLVEVLCKPNQIPQERVSWEISCSWIIDYASDYLVVCHVALARIWRRSKYH
jgi:hypothetical protein